MGRAASTHHGRMYQGLYQLSSVLYQPSEEA